MSNQTQSSTLLEKTVKLAIVGGGPAGLTAGIYAGRANLEPILISGGFEGGSMIPGGQLMITTDVENYPGFPDGISGPDLIMRMQEQAIKCGVKEIQEFVVKFEFKSGGPHRLKLSNGETIRAMAVILAMGAQAKWLGAENEETFLNKGISACATCDGPMPVFRDQPILVVGGGDSAVEEATYLAKFASHVYMVVRRDVLRASKIMQKRALSNPKLEILWNTVIKTYHGDSDGWLAGVTLVSTKEKEDGTEKEQERQIPCKGVFMAIGHSPCTVHLRKETERDENEYVTLDDVGYIKSQNNINTNIEGVFTAGDIHDHTYRQAISAAGFGCMASIAAERWLESKE